jgi:hypothetical protein
MSKILTNALTISNRFVAIACLGLSTAIPAATAAASAADVRCELTLQGDRIQFRSGERIELKMAFIAEEPGYAVNTTIFAGPSPADTIVLTPGKGVYPWSADLGRFTYYQNDTVTIDELLPQTPVEVPMPICGLASDTSATRSCGESIE